MKRIEITEGQNGYPTNVHTGYCDFSNIEEAETYAKEVNGDVVILHRRDGWHLWESLGSAYGPIVRSEDDYGDMYRLFASKEDYLNDRNELRSELEDEMDADELAAFDAETDEMVAEFQPGYGVVLYAGKYFETIKNETMSYCFDTHNYEIGVEVRN